MARQEIENFLGTKDSENTKTSRKHRTRGFQRVFEGEKSLWEQKSCKNYSTMFHGFIFGFSFSTRCICQCCGIDMKPRAFNKQLAEPEPLARILGLILSNAGA
jgi:hypothetical protein